LLRWQCAAVVAAFVVVVVVVVVVVFVVVFASMPRVQTKRGATRMMFEANDGSVRSRHQIKHRPRSRRTWMPGCITRRMFIGCPVFKVRLNDVCPQAHG
jgi:hypothetical protein